MEDVGEILAADFSAITWVIGQQEGPSLQDLVESSFFCCYEISKYFSLQKISCLDPVGLMTHCIHDKVSPLPGCFLCTLGKEIEDLTHKHVRENAA